MGNKLIERICTPNWKGNRKISMINISNNSSST